MTQHAQIRRSTPAAARRGSSTSYAAEHVPLTDLGLLAEGDADVLLARAYRLRKKRIAARVSAARTSALLR